MRVHCTVYLKLIMTNVWHYLYHYTRYITNTLSIIIKKRYLRRTWRQAGARRGASTEMWVCKLCRSTECACIRILRLPPHTSRLCSVLRRVLCTQTTLGTRTRPRRAAGVRMSRTCWIAPGTTSSACSNCNDKTLRYHDVS